MNRVATLDDGKARALLASPRTLLIVSLLTIALLAAGNLPWQLEDYDQAKQAFTSWQMVKEGRIFYEQNPSGRVATKPPLVGWVSALLYQCTRSWDVAWRVPSFAAALVIACLLWRRASECYGAATATLALAAFGFNLLTARIATLVRTDMPLSLASFLIALLFFAKIRDRARWRMGDQTMLFLLLAATMLIKGPIVYAFVLPALVLFWWRFRRRAELGAIATGWWPWVASLALFAAWVIGGIKTVPGFYDEVVVREFLGRFGETIHRPQPLYFYFPHLLHKFAPWSLLLIGIGIANFRRARHAGESRRRRLSPEAFWLLAWAVGGLVVMSCIPSKRVDRIFPVVPPLCLLLAALTAPELAAGSSPKRAYWCAISLLAAIVFTGSYTLFKIFTGVHEHRVALVQCGREFRTQAARQGWRYAVLRDNTEALVLYFDVPTFVDGKEAIERWNGGEIDALVLNRSRAESLRPALKPAARATELCRLDDGYIVLVR